MAITRESLLLKWNGGATIRAFRVLQESYKGGTKTKPASYSRSLYDDGLLIVRATGKRRFFGALTVLDSPSATLDGASEGSIAEAKLAHDATDLQVKSFEDSDYWDAEWMGDWDALCQYDPLLNRAIAIANIEEK